MKCLLDLFYVGPSHGLLPSELLLAELISQNPPYLQTKSAFSASMTKTPHKYFTTPFKRAWRSSFAKVVYSDTLAQKKAVKSNYVEGETNITAECRPNQYEARHWFKVFYSSVTIGNVVLLHWHVAFECVSAKQTNKWCNLYKQHLDYETSLTSESCQ